MGKVFKHIAIGFVAFFAGVMPAQADLTLGVSPLLSNNVCVTGNCLTFFCGPRFQPTYRSTLAHSFDSLLAADQLLMPALAAPEGAWRQSDRAAPMQAREMPAAPGSAALFLSAMASFGAWHLVRSARHISLMDVPSWYHTGGPIQIGHSVPIDLDFGAGPLCRFERSSTEKRPLFHIRFEHDLRKDPQAFLTCEVPRGPPLLH